MAAVRSAAWSWSGLNLELKHLVVFMALFDEGSIMGAARRCGVSDSLVRNRLATLRLHFSDKLFTPIAGRLQPTETAVKLEQEARGPLSAILATVLPLCSSNVSDGGTNEESQDSE